MDDLPFVLRDNELDLLFYSVLSRDNNSRSIIINGDSGTGKSYLVKKVTFECIEENSIHYSLYFDIAKDSFTTSLFFETLMYYSWTQQNASFYNPTKISIQDSFSNFIKKYSLKKTILRKLFKTISSSIELLPYFGKPITCILPESDDNEHSNDPTPNIAFTFFKYIETIAKKKRIVISIDNYQFLDRSTRILFENLLNNIQENIVLIVIDRTICNTKNIELLRCYSDNQQEISLANFDLNETKEMISVALSDKIVGMDFITDCYKNTNGNLKEIELLIQAYKTKGDFSNSRIPIRKIHETISNLNEIDKYLLIIAGFFPAGLKKDIVFKIVSRSFLCKEIDVVTTIKELITLGYLIINSKNGELVKPTHEKIITSIKKAITDEEFIEIHQMLLTAFEDILSEYKKQKEYSYLLHCFVGISNITYLRNKVNYLIELIDIQYNENLYQYIVTIYKQIPEAVSLLPEYSILKILDSIQKTSEFYIGLSLISQIKNKNLVSNTNYKLYYAKYLIQTYQYHDALEIINSISCKNESYILYKLNILQHLGKNSEAKALLSTLILNKASIHYTYIAFRNSAHLFSYDEAIYNISKAKTYFEEKGSSFAVATCHNNLGVVFLWNNEIEHAELMFFNAIEMFLNINSNEIFEPYCNLAVIEAIKGNYTYSRDFFQKSQHYVSENLKFDYILLKHNSFALELIEKGINAFSYLNEYLNLSTMSKQIGDPWLTFQIEYNLNIIRKNNNEKIKKLNPNILRGLLNRINTGQEVLINSTLDHNTKILFSLSPHWRY